MKLMGQETFLIHLLLSTKQRISKNVALINSVFTSIIYSLNKYYISTVMAVEINDRSKCGGEKEI